MKKYIQNSRFHLYLLILTNAVYGALTAIVPIIAGIIIDYDTETERALSYFSG